jgi:hypothetical protein
MSFGTDQEDKMKGLDPVSRWTTGLAKAMYDPMVTLQGQQAQADAVEELTRLAADVTTLYSCKCGKCAVCKLRAAVEAAKNWK